MSEVTMENTDSMIYHLLKFNAENPVQYNGHWYPPGTLKQLLTSAPIPSQERKTK